MIMRIVSVAIALGTVAAFPPLAWAGPADGAAEAFDQGDVLLAKGDFDAALKAYATAAKADSANQAYRQQYSVVRRVIKMRKRIEKESNPEKWASTAEALRAFYYEHGVYAEALPLDRQFHARVNTPQSAAMLAQTQLELGMDAETAALLSSLDKDKTSPRTQVLLGIALARQGKLDEAKGIAKDFAVPKDAGPPVLWDLARLRALVGDSSDALGLLTRCFESTPPSRLDAAKTEAKESNDFRTLLANADFAKALETKSKVKESGCSGGSRCGKCPSRASCGKSSTASSSGKKP